jgi:hypothetical protein
MAGKIDFGTRVCQVCQQSISAENFGSHIFTHNLDDIVTKWPGGLHGVMVSLKESIRESIRRVDDAVTETASLRRTLAKIEGLERSLNKK